MQSIREVIQQALGMLEKEKTTVSPSESVRKDEVGKQDLEFTQRLAFLEWKGKELYGEHFRLYGEDYPLLVKLLAYVAGDRERAELMGLSLRKGILLLGPIGCGKTSLMTLLRLFLPRRSATGSSPAGR